MPGRGTVPCEQAPGFEKANEPFDSLLGSHRRLYRRLLINAQDCVVRAVDGLVRLTSHCYEPVFRPARDVCLLLEPMTQCAHAADPVIRSPGKAATTPRNYTVSFTGAGYVIDPGLLRLNLLGLTNAALRVYIALNCSSNFFDPAHPRAAWRLKLYGPRRSMCPPPQPQPVRSVAAAAATVDNYCTMARRSVYSLVPEGRQPATYRFLEVLCAGSIPLMYTDKSRWHWPFPSSISEEEWRACVAVVREPVLITKLAWEHRHGSLEAQRRGAACLLIRKQVCTQAQRKRLYIKEIDGLANLLGTTAEREHAPVGAKPPQPPRPPSNASACIAALSKAQHGEDKYVLPLLLAVTDGAAGSFVELGALDGVRYSNTYALERCLGWYGVLIEADPVNFEMLLNRTSERNVTRVHAAVCDEATGAIPMSVGGGPLSGARAQMPSAARLRFRSGSDAFVRLIPCKPLHTLVRAAGLASGGADFLSLDVEGSEELVLRSALPGAFKAVLVETDGANPKKEAAVRSLLEAAGHVLVRELRLGPPKAGGWSQLYLLRAIARARNWTTALPEVVLSTKCRRRPTKCGLY